MHLPRAEIAAVLRASFGQLRPGGVLIFGVPSALRRQLTGFQPPTWHAHTALGSSDVVALAGPRWRLKATRGILFFPIHRIPAGVRFLLRPLDSLCGRTPLKQLCSYVFYCLERPR